jgi:hypothetical protein
VEEVAVDAFDLGLARNNVTEASRSKTRLDFALETMIPVRMMTKSPLVKPMSMSCTTHSKPKSRLQVIWCLNSKTFGESARRFWLYQNRSRGTRFDTMYMYPNSQSIAITGYFWSHNTTFERCISVFQPGFVQEFHRAVETQLMPSTLGCSWESVVCYFLAFWFGSMTYWCTQNLSMSIFQTWEKYSRDCSSSTWSWAPRKASCLLCILSGVRGRYPRMEFSLILCIWRDLGSYLVQRQQSIFSIFSAQSIESEVRFQTKRIV